MNPTAKALTVLETVAGSSQAIRLGEIAQLANMTKPTTHRILRVLVDAGYVLADGDGHYSAGPRLLGLAGLTLRDREYRRHVGPHLHQLQERTGLTVHFALLAQDDAVYVEKVEPTRPYQMASRVGMHIPLHCTAIGKSIVAELDPDDARSRLGAEPYEKRTGATRHTWAALEKDLDQIRQRGFAIDEEENETNVRCVGAPVHDSLARICGAVSVSSLTFQFSTEEAEAVGPLVRAAALAISKALGAPTPSARNGMSTDG